MEDQRIDLSPLDPARDSREWESTIQRLAAHVVATRQDRQGLGRWLFAWGRPALALAAVCALAVWWAGGATPPKPVAATATNTPALSIAAWAAQDSVPATAELFAVVEALHDTP